MTTAEASDRPASSNHFLYRGLSAPPPAKTIARRAEWPQGYPLDSIIRLCRAKGLPLPVER